MERVPARTMTPEDPNVAPGSGEGQAGGPSPEPAQPALPSSRRTPSATSSA
jgi:hypothetical protein